MANTRYGDISPRTAAYAAAEMLKRGLPHLVLEKFGQSKPLPTSESKTQKFRRYSALSLATTPLTEGVTPSSKQLSHTDVTANLDQYGDVVTITDVVMDTHEDPVLMEAVEILGEQAAQTVETVRFNVLKAGTNVVYANGSTRSDVKTEMTLATQRKATRSLKRQNARAITKVVKSTPSYGTEPVKASFIGLIHPDMESVIRGFDNFIPAEKYGSTTPYECELGKVDDVRYIYSTIFQPWDNAGGAKGLMISNGDSSADVYPCLIISQDAYGIIPLKGKTALTPAVVNPKPTDSDPLGQRGHASWKTMQTAVILNDAWMVRIESAVTD